MGSPTKAPIVSHHVEAQQSPDQSKHGGSEAWTCFCHDNAPPPGCNAIHWPRSILAFKGG